MPASRLVILSVAAIAAAGAGYVAKNMMAPPPPEIVAASPSAPAVPLADVLILTADVPMGQPLFENIGWERWPEAGVNEGFIT